MASIADLFGKLLLDDSGFEASVVKSAGSAADAATKTMGQRVSAGFKTALGAGLKTVAVGTALAMGVATKGVLELENATARFRSETGATAAEAEAMGKTINRVAGDEQTSLDAVTDAAIRVKRDLGLTGDAADAMTARIVRFARVTKQDAAAAVGDLDDLTDAYNLNAEDQAVILDKLLVSQQKYGGSITENQKALAKMAPQLKALNLTYDDGIGLLNLFAASGLDAASGQKALNAAITNLPKGESLTEFIARLSTVTDDGERARQAIEVFGAKGGAGLANAIRPGISSLQAFEVSAAEAAGATDKAADVIDSTVSGRIAKAFSVASAQLREFGAGFGPAATGIASIVSLAGAAGGGKLASAILGPIGGLGKKLGVKLAAALAVSFGSSAVAGAASAGGELIGDLSLKQIEKRLAGTAMADAVTSAGESSAVTKAAATVGTKIGIVLGTAMKVAAVIGIAAIASEVAGPVQDLGKNIHQALLGGDNPLSDFGAAWTKWRQETPWPLGQKDAPDWASLGGEVKTGLDTAIVQPMKATAVQAALTADDLAVSLGDHATDAIEIMRTKVANDSASSAASLKRIGDAAKKTADETEAAGRRIRAASAETRQELTDDASALLSDYWDPIIAHDRLAAAEAEAAAARKVIASKKSTDAEVADARRTLHSVTADMDQLRLNLLESGNLTKKEQAAWLADLQTRYKTATGNAKRDVGLLINKVHELQANGHVTIAVDVQTAAASRKIQGIINQIRTLANSQINFGVSGGGRAAGGPVQAGVPYIVGERRAELFVPSVSGRIVPRVPSTGMGGGGPINVTMNLTANGTDTGTARRFGQAVLDVVAGGLREQTARMA